MSKVIEYPIEVSKIKQDTNYRVYQVSWNQQVRFM